MVRPVLLACALLLGGCKGSETFECAQDGDCQGSEAFGYCESNGWCSFPDDRCPSMRRYGTLAGNGLAGMCVPEDDGTGDDGSTSIVTTGEESSESSPPTTSPVTTETPGPVCGNGVREGDEPCDGQDFGDETCMTLGHLGGSLDCDDCTIEEDECTDCGDGVVQGDEACDTSIPAQNCADFGWFAGTIVCADDCSALDESGCTNCGNGEVDVGEHCDLQVGTDVTCNALGFDEGTLGCGSDCLYDVSMCGGSVCGIDPTLAVGPCPPECTSCLDNTCLFDCTGDSACSNDDIVCPVGWTCRVNCDGSSACAGGSVVCPDYYTCVVDCAGTSACAGMDINCSANGTCWINCSVDASACANADVDCGGDQCTAECNGQDPALACGPSCACADCS